MSAPREASVAVDAREAAREELVRLLRRAIAEPDVTGALADALLAYVEHSPGTLGVRFLGSDA